MDWSKSWRDIWRQDKKSSDAGMNHDEDWLAEYQRSSHLCTAPTVGEALVAYRAATVRLAELCKADPSLAVQASDLLGVEATPIETADFLAWHAIRADGTLHGRAIINQTVKQVALDQLKEDR